MTEIGDYCMDKALSGMGFDVWRRDGKPLHIDEASGAPVKRSHFATEAGALGFIDRKNGEEAECAHS